MAALATLSDVQARLTRTIASGETARVRALIDDASAAIITESGQDVIRAETEARLMTRNINRELVVVLPQRPVNSITSVADINGNAVTYVWDGATKLTLTSSADTVHSDTLDRSLRYVDVTYDHGYDDANDTRNVLGTVAGVVANVVARAFGTPAEETGKTAETIGPYSYSIGAGAAQGGFGLMSSEWKTIKRALGRRRAGTIQL